MIDKVLGVRELLRSLDYKVEGLSRIFFDNKGMVTVVCGVNMTIKKCSIALAFHRIRKAIPTDTVELQYISGDLN